MSELFSNLPTIEKIEKKNLKEILGRFPNQKIAVVGDVGVDKYTVGDVDRISPEAPVPVLKVSEELRKLGLAANVAENLKTMEADPLLIGVIEASTFFKFPLLSVMLIERLLNAKFFFNDSRINFLSSEFLVKRNSNLFPIASSSEKQVMRDAASLNTIILSSLPITVIPSGIIRVSLFLSIIC